MKFFDLAAMAVGLVEQGVMPDALTRAGIRGLCRKRLREETASADAPAFLKTCRAGPVARVPEKANQQHYEVPAEFFELVLGPRQKYSCCEWSRGVESLADAEAAALRCVCDRAGIEDGMDVLDLGCGWGSFSLWVLEQFPRARVLAVSNSESQREVIERRVNDLGFANRLEVVTADVNDFRPSRTFDRVVSIEMFEHVTNHAALLERISEWLHAEGKLFVHIFCHRQLAYFFESRNPSDWMAEHFFTGGMMPSASLMRHYDDHMSIVAEWKVSGLDYERTCNAWLANLTAQRRRVMPILRRTYGSQEAKRWYHRWRIFFMACAELFGFQGGEEWFVSHYLLEKVVNQARVHAHAVHR